MAATTGAHAAAALKRDAGRSAHGHMRTHARSAMLRAPLPYEPCFACARMTAPHLTAMAMRPIMNIELQSLGAGSVRPRWMSCREGKGIM